MAEKNTLSILETIKKKMQKLDQKSEKSDKISAVSDEFEYISPAKKQSDAQSSEAQKTETKISPEISPVAQNSMPKFEDDLGLEDLKNSAAESAAAPSQASPEAKPVAENSDAPNLDDLDLDDESLVDKTAASAPPVATAEAEVKKADPQKESGGDEIDFLKELELQFEAQSQAKNASKASDNPVQQEVKPEAQQEIAEPENVEKDILDFEAEAKEPVVEIQVNSQPQVQQPQQPQVQEIRGQEIEKQEVEKKDDDELNFDDLDMDDSEEHLTAVPQEVAAPPPAPAVASSSQTDDISLDELDRLLAEQQTKKEVESNTKTAQSKESLATSSDEVDLEFEKEIMSLKPEAVNPTAVQQKADELEIEDVAEVLEKPAIPVQLAVEAAPQASATPAKKEEVKPFQTSHQAVEQLFQSIQQPEKSVDQSNVSIMNLQAIPEKEKTGMINDITVAQSTESIKRLIDAKNVVAGISSFSQSSVFRELATQLMEPKLEKWLNENLSEVVEEIVREEIKKIIPKE